MCRDSKGVAQGPCSECRKHWDPKEASAAAATCVALPVPPALWPGRSHRLEGWEGGRCTLLLTDCLACSYHLSGLSECVLHVGLSPYLHTNSLSKWAVRHLLQFPLTSPSGPVLHHLTGKEKHRVTRAPARL